MLTSWDLNKNLRKKRQTGDSEKILPNYICDKELVPKIVKNSQELIVRKQPTK